ncbi:esterase [Sinomonas sp. R1AF57]|nr:esterase [Sinomonas sp. R1AF57]
MHGMDSPSGPIGVALSHGFGGSLAGVAPWADALQEAGFRVSAPLLPGHGTSWQDLATRSWGEWYEAYEAAYHELAQDCSTVIAAGLSMGGALALRLAARQKVGGAVVVNPALVVDDPRSYVSVLLQHALRSVPGIANDIKLAGADEGAYARLPVRAAHQMKLMFRDTVASLPSASAPLLVFRSTVDRVVTSERSVAAIARLYGGDDIRIVRLRDSYHVATLDNDAPTVFRRSVDFIREVAGLAAPTGHADAAGSGA